MMCEGASSAAATVSTEKIKIHLEDDDNSAAVEQRAQYRCVHNAYTLKGLSIPILHTHEHTPSLTLGHTTAETATKTNNHHSRERHKKPTYMHQPSVFIQNTNSENVTQLPSASPISFSTTVTKRASNP